MRLVLACLLAVVAPALADERPTHLQDVPRQIEQGRMQRRDERSGSFDIQIGSLEPAGLRATSANVRIKNLSDFAIEDIDLICTAFDEKENELASTSWRLKEAGGGPMQPGESTAVTLRFDASSNEVRAASCNARGW